MLLAVMLIWMCGLTLAQPPEQDRALQEARRLSGEADRLSTATKYEEALPLAERVLILRQQALGLEHADVAMALDQLATIHRRKGDLAKAEPLALKALAMAEKTFGPNDSNLGLLVNDLGVIYYNKPDLIRAEPLFERALAIWERTLGPNHPSVGRVLTNLAALRNAKGERDTVEPLLLRALPIQEQELGKEDPRVANTISSLGSFYFERGDYVKAEPLYDRALKIYEKRLGADHPQVAIGLTNLATARHYQSKLADAETDYRRAQAIFEARKVEHPDAIRVVLNLAELHADRGDYAQAKLLHERALMLREKSLGPDHPGVAAELANLGRVQAASGELAQAVASQSRGVAISERNIAHNLADGSEGQKLAFLSTLLDETNVTISLHARSAPDNAAARDLALTTILQRKGRALDAMTDSIAALRRRATPEDQKLLDQLKEARARLARLVLDGPQRTTLAEHQSRIKVLEQQRETLEGEISRRSAGFRAQSQPVTISAVQAAIPAQAVLIEFAVYRPYNPRYTKVAERFGPSRYVAYVLFPNAAQAEGRWVDLGEQQPIDSAIDQLRRALRDRNRQDVKQLAREIDRLVMQPVRPLLGKTRRVFISPDGALNLVPFAAFVDERRHYLIKHYTFSYLTSGRDLLRLNTRQARPAGKQRAMVVANPNFGDAEDAGTATERILKYRSGSATVSGSGSILAEAYFPPMPGTADEAKAIKTLLSEAILYEQAQATETVVKQANSPRILHIATHGFFLEDRTIPVTDARLLVRTSAEAQAGARPVNPLLRSGLALAGANRRQIGAGEDDGILTALEAAALDLFETQLVVLSACDTGIGEVKNGDGVYGLRRALFLAGAETQVMSLWPASDFATRDLMIEYHRALQRGEGRATALRQVQLRMLDGKLRNADNGKSRILVTKTQTDKSAAQPHAKNYSHPYYWANFIQSGEWASLDGQR